MYDKVPNNMNFVEREVQVEKYWKDNDIFGKSIKAREGAPVFTFYDGPPTANGKPHIGHIITRAVKDLIPRYKTMKGYKVLRKAGWDTHGLPVELEVEKTLGLDGKDQIEGYGVEPFIEKCKESVWTYEQEWRSMSDRVGFWADMDHPYVTYHNDYIESEWWALKQIWDKGLLYKGHKVVPYCPRCGTALSSHEVAQGYKDVKETSAIAKFKMEGTENTYFLAWTTTPWTLPSNVILSVNANETYVKAKYQDYYVIMAEALLDSVLGEGNYEVVESMKGSDLEYVKYEPLFDFQPNGEDFKGYFVTCDDYVTLTDGTGIVHTAYAYGEDDYRVCKKYDVTFYQNVDTTGHLNSLAGPFEGLFVKDADPVILKYMEENGTLFAALPFEHNYPFCWRCDTPLLYYARSTWFIKMTALRDNLVRNNRTINWYPDNIKEGRFGNFLENVIDWGLSRERYWGTPLPIWECECGHRHTIGSIAELKEMSPDCPDNIELHKPFIDAVHITCPKCGKLMTRVPEVIDCWFDSGSMPFAQWHYPFENKDIFDENFPADFISEAVDQTRGWFYTLLAVSTLLFDKAPYKNCIVLGHVQDKDGQKMSKHKGNVVNPWDALNKQGADAVRWYFYANSAPWLPSRYYDEAVSEMQRKFMGTLWNTYAFYVLYANIDNFDATKYIDRKEARKMDLYTQYAIVVAKEAVEDSGLDIEKEDLNKIGVIFGAGIGGIHTFEEEVGNYYTRQEMGPKFNPFFIPKMISDIAAGQISIMYGFHGPNYATCSACATSTNAIADAFNLIRLGKANVIVSGGSEAAIFPAGVGGFNAMHALSTRNDEASKASRPFSASRDGFIMGEGGGCLILEELEHAKARGAKIYAEVAGVGMSADAHHLTASHPEGLGAKLVMKNALEDAGMDPKEVDYINVHGTSTPVGDISEAKAIKEVFGDHAFELNISSTKSMTGHLLGAAGAVESIASILAIKNGIVPPTINHEEGDNDENIDYNLNFTFNKAQKREVNVALSNTFGFGGHNACVIFKKYAE